MEPKNGTSTELKRSSTGTSIVEGYRETELGTLPEEWEIKNLSDLAKICYGKAKPKEKGEIPVYGSGGIYSYTNQELINFKTLIIGRKGSAGSVFLNKENSWASDTTFFLDWKTEVNVEFIYYYTSLNMVSGEEAKTTLPSLQRSRLENLLIPHPPRYEQQKIVSVLSTVQYAIEKSDAIMEAAKSLKKSMMKHLFTYGLVPVNEAEDVPLMETDVGMVHEDWKILPLREIADIKSGGTPSRKKPEYWNGEIPWVKTGEINYNRITETEEKISLEGLENSSARMIPEGTILMAMYGQGVTRGRVSILGIDASINQACAAIFPSNLIRSDYLFYFLSFNYEKIRNMGHGAHQKNLSATLIKTIPIAVPTLKEQKNMARILNGVDKKIQSELKNINILHELFKTLRNDLMTAKVRVNDLEV